MVVAMNGPESGCSSLLLSLRAHSPRRRRSRDKSAMQAPRSIAVNKQQASSLETLPPLVERQSKTSLELFRLHKIWHIAAPETVAFDSAERGSHTFAPIGCGRQSEAGAGRDVERTRASEQTRLHKHKGTLLQEHPSLIPHLAADKQRAGSLGTVTPHPQAQIPLNLSAVGGQVQGPALI